MMTKLALVFAIALAACASSAIPTARFHNAPAVTAVDDHRDTPVAPASRNYIRALVQFRSGVVRPISRTLDLVRDRRALGVNALDEVPDSTWFTNRIGVRDVSLDEIRTGPIEVGTPEAHLPWTVLSTKVGGMNVGFIIADARGEKFILKFDEVGQPETETGADAILSRIVWAAGYNVPEDHVVYFRASDLVLSPKAKIKDIFGHARTLGRDELAQLLAKIDVGADGRIRGLASHMLAGTWLGGPPTEGTRADDPNDRIAHELRRDLRGSYALFGWLDHIDIKEDNFLDMYVADPASPKHHYVKHYVVDFGSALGSQARTGGDLRSGHEYYLGDFGAMLRSLLTLGAYERPWEGRTGSAIRGVGVYDVGAFDPSAWKPNNPSYLPFHTADRFDQFWGAKIMMRFTRAQLRAAVEAGRFSDPAAVDYLTNMLVARQRVAAAHWFAQVAPIDRPEVVLASSGYAVCFDDLSLAYRLSNAATQYTIASYDRAGTRLATQAPLHPTASGRTCTASVTLAADADAYTIVEIRTTRASLDGTTYIHLARDGGAIKVVGIWRQ